MKSHATARTILRGVLVATGTALVILSVSLLTFALSGRAAAVQATSAQAVPTIAPLTPVPTTTVAPRVGDLILYPALQAVNPGGNTMLTMRVTDKAPLITQQEAQQVALDTGYAYAVDNMYGGRKLTLTSVYGLLTYGQPGDTSGLHGGDGKSPLTGSCAGWLGPCNFPIQTCQVGRCQDTGRTIGRIEDRPYWLLDYGNVLWERQGCPGCPKQTFNHVVLIVDAQDKFVLMGFGYTAPQ